MRASPASADRARAGGRGWSRLAWLGIAALLGLRLWLINASPVNGLELQQAHLAWSWNQGELPYRDVMDLYPPLLGWWERGPVAWLGPQASILTSLRGVAQLWYVLSLYALWSIGRRLYGPAAGLSAMVLVGLYPSWFAGMGQAGIVGPWCALTLGALAVLAGARDGGQRGRAWWAGCLAGLALCLCLQMAWLLSLMALATVAVSLRQLGERAASPLRLFGWGMLGLITAPVLWLLWFACHGALPALMAWLGDEALGDGSLAGGWRMVVCLLLALAGMVWISWRFAAVDAAARPAWRLFMALNAWLYLTLVVMAWPWYDRPDFAPMVALSGLVLCGELARWPGLRGGRGPAAALLLAGIELACIGWSLPAGRDALRGERSTLATVLRYSAPGDPVMDAEGAAVFRPRPYYPLLAGPSGGRSAPQRAPDTVADELVRHADHLVIREALPPVSDSFVARNYLQLQGAVYAAGLALPPVAIDGAERPLRLELPGDYTLTDGLHAVCASMDGHPPASHWRLATGTHYLQASTPGPLWLVDSRAWRAGWRPGQAAGRAW